MFDVPFLETTVHRKNVQSTSFLVKLKKSATKTFQILTETYGDETLSRVDVFEWYKRFPKGRISVEDDEPAGRPRENAMANAFWVSVRNNISKRWNTTENDVSKNQSSADSEILQLDFRIQTF
ncbi:hypothetical protein TNCV_1012361 [Trichonephila clavipes]|uniref:Mos1 transposase HTH domain-containing protein n=1 Tax=Trichonephila clavipes TaxID=2585209 RepID=A0A8X7B9Q0_TRICX|nr:hypothetical protein TNCV_1012361 [Trichonephila clavipes]